MGNANMIKAMADMGFQPTGSIPKRNTLDTILDAVSQFSQINQDHQKKQQEQKTKAFGEYKTLRSSGYSSKKAYDITLKDYPEIPPPDMPDVSKAPTTLDILSKTTDIEHKQAQTKKIAAETKEVGQPDKFKERKMELDAEIKREKIAADRELNETKKLEIEAKIGKLTAEKTKIETETGYLGPESKKSLTADQQKKSRIGKRQLIQEIGHWGKTGQVYRSAEKDYIDIPDENSLKMFLINESKRSSHFDLDDPNISQSIANAVKKQFQVDLTKDDKGQKVKGKNLVSKIQDWVFGERRPGQETQFLGVGLGSKEERYRYLTSQGKNENEAMLQMIDEGY